MSYTRFPKVLRALSAFALVAAAVGPLSGCTASTASEDTQGTQDQLASADRSAIMNALRVAVRPELKNQDIVFDVSHGHFKATSEFAFLSGQIELKSTGGPIDYRGTIYQADIDEGFFDDHIDALLQKKDGKWTVLAHAIGSTDVAWTTWPEVFHAPNEIFPFTTNQDPAADERHEVMDALRSQVAPQLNGQDIVFNVSDGVYATEGDWAFMRGVIRLRDGGLVDYAGTTYEADIRDGQFKDGFAALLHKDDGVWTVTTEAIGTTYVAWTDWADYWGAPASIIH